jgi:hypothetical protein
MAQQIVIAFKDGCGNRGLDLLDLRGSKHHLFGRNQQGRAVTAPQRVQASGEALGLGQDNSWRPVLMDTEPRQVHRQLLFERRQVSVGCVVRDLQQTVIS